MRLFVGAGVVNSGFASFTGDCERRYIRSLSGVEAASQTLHWSSTTAAEHGSYSRWTMFGTGNNNQELPGYSAGLLLHLSYSLPIRSIPYLVEDIPGRVRVREVVLIVGQCLSH